MKIWQRVILFAGAVGMVHPGLASDAAGFAVILLVAVPNFLQRSATRALPVQDLSPEEAQDMDADVAAPEGLEAGRSFLLHAAGWAILVAGSIVVAALGSRAIHSSDPVAWLVALGVVGLLTTGLIVLDRSQWGSGAAASDPRR